MLCRHLRRVRARELESQKYKSSLPSFALLWEHVHMMSALGGGGGSPKADNSTDKLRECDTDKGFADVIQI